MSRSWCVRPQNRGARCVGGGVGGSVRGRVPYARRAGHGEPVGAETGGPGGMGSVKPVGAETGGPGGTGNRDLVGAKTGAADGQGTDIPQPVLSDAGRAVPVAESEPRAVRGKAQREGRPACSSPAVSG